MKLRSAALAAAVLVATVSVLTLIPSSVEAATRTWTTDADFTGQGAGGSAPIFNGVEVVGTADPASVQLLKDWTDWNNANPSGPPSPRESLSFAYAGSGKSLLFGGWDGTHDDETWEYDATANTWTKLNPSPRPVARSSAGLSYDPVEGVVVLFGGTNGVTIFRDTWEFDPGAGQWAQILPPLSPPEMQDTPLVYHAATANHILFGMNANTLGMETWAYDASLNTWEQRSPSGSPSARVQHALAYHEIRGRTVLFGGGSLGGVILGDTWEYNDSPSSWVQTSGGPPNRMRHGMAYRPASGSVFLFGGFAGPSGVLDDSWEYSSSASWSFLGTVAKPSARQEMGLVHDGAAGVIVMFGGSDFMQTLLGDTWKLGPAYRLAGKYTSAVFDATQATVDWQTLWWNKTSQPANTFLRFQVAASNVVTGPFAFVGPNCQATGYHTAPNQPICATLDSKRYFRFLADFGTFDSSVTPVMEDVTLVYDVPPADPYVVATDPYHLMLDVPLDKVVRITFSEPMNRTSLGITFLIGTPVNFTATWSAADSIVDLSHPAEPFPENKPYRLQVSAMDLQGRALVGGPVPNPFRFTTLKTYPTIVSTDPPHQAPAANKTRPIVVTFSEPMDVTTFSVNITPLIVLNASWDVAETVVTLSHAEWFSECNEYTVSVAAEDKAGLPLFPSVPNPWKFTVECTSPYLLETSPMHLEGDVAVNRAVTVKFSEAMNTSPSVTGMTISPNVAGQQFSWTEGSTRLTMTHTQAFMGGTTVYTVTVFGRDLEGKSMVAGPPSAAPNPFRFVTVGANPYIQGTLPADGDVNVSPTQSIFVGFSIQMNEPTVTYTITPSLTGLGESWGFSQQLEILHDPFAQYTLYTVEITSGMSQTGFPLVPGPVPNPWSFSTICEGPQVTSTDPADEANLVALDKVVRVTFSEPMSIGSVVATSTPSITFGQTWTGDQTVDFTHLRDFDPCTRYEITVTGLGQDGNTIAPGPVPNPWQFATVCTLPQILSTDPVDNAMNVPLNASITVRFSEPMDVGTVAAVPTPLITLNASWSDANQTLTLTHAAPFQPLTTYSIAVDGNDLDGNALIPGPVPNPWSFRTAAPPSLPAPGGLQVVGSPPNVTLSWQAVDGATRYAIHSSGNRFSPWPWPVIDTVTTTSYVAVGHYADGAPHFYIVRARDDAGTESPNSTMGVKMPMTFLFSGLRSNIYWISLPYRSIYSRASDISDELGSSRVSVVAKWDPESQGTILWFFFRGQWRGTDFPIAPGDGLLLGITSGFQWVVTGTDGSVALPFVLFPLPSENIYWISLPYTSTYVRASDIVLHLEGSLGPAANTKIVEVGKWDPLTDSTVRFYWTPSGWVGGTDFAIQAGEGLYLRIVADFSWIPRLLTPEVP